MFPKSSDPKPYADATPEWRTESHRAEAKRTRMQDAPTRAEEEKAMKPETSEAELCEREA